VSEERTADAVEGEQAPVLVVLGTRPEIVKLGPVVQALGPRAAVVHTGQHWDAGLSDVFLDQLGMPAPLRTLGVGGGSRGRQLGQAVALLDEVLADLRPAAVVVQGDTTSALAGALAGNAAEVPVAHVEAGLRSFDRAMPEEHNRVLVDAVADLCLAPTETSRQHLLAVGVPEERIRVTGNTVVDALRALLPDAAGRDDALAAHGLEREGYVLSTFHRPENVDDPAVLAAVLEQLEALALPVVLPVHPRLRARADAAGLGPTLDALHAVEPLDYVTFLALLAECALAVSDSGGVQEEVSVVKRPGLVVRRSTERPEVLGTFTELVGPGPAIGAAAAPILADPSAAHRRLQDVPSPYGDGHAGERCADAVRSLALRSP
jgi:UDP-N-acetylglucosamine 2-epimerase (non-hydrolysing)